MDFVCEESTKLRRYLQQGMARYWHKRLKKSKPEIEAAIAKLGNNAETVMRELGVKREVVAGTLA